MNDFAQSRALPADVRDILEEIVGTEIKHFDGRRKVWEPIEYLEELGWVEGVEIKHKNPLTRAYRATEAGKYALERSRRGVDPYLRMTP